MFCDSKNKYILRFFAVFLAAVFCFGFTPAVFAMENNGDNAEIQEETNETYEQAEPEEPKVTSGTCGTDLRWDFSGGNLIITGSGAMTDFPESTMAPWYGMRDEILNVVLPDGITSIGDFAFYGCGEIISVSIPKSVTRIGFRAFAYCEKTRIFNLGTGIRVIEDEAFSNCRAAVFFRLPESLEKIGFKAFYRCELITSVSIPSKVNSIGVLAFGYCKNLITANIEANITFLPEYVFYNCIKLTVVNLPESLLEIGESAFSGCDELSEVYYNGEEISPEELQDSTNGSVSIEEENDSDSSSGGILMGNADGTITAENTTVTEGEDSTVSATTETIISPEGEVIESTEPVVTVTISGENGWGEATGALEDILDEYGTADDGSERHIGINLYIQGTESIDAGFIESIAGKDVTVTVTTENGSVWVISGKDINTAELSGNYSLAYVLEAGSAELCEELGASSCFVLRFLAPAEINAEVMIRIGGSYARRNATLFQDGKEIKKVQSVVVDNEGYAHFYLGSVTDETEYYIALDIAGAEEEVIIPQNMLAEYGNAEYIEPIKYEITGRTSSWGMNLGQVMSILAVVMVTVIIVVGAVMFFWNRQRLKNGYVPQMDDEE